MRKKFICFLLTAVFVSVSCGSDDAGKSGDVYDAVIIGAGGGGMSAASRLAREGKKVLVIEQHYRVGGYMTNFTRGDYRFEISLHAMDNLDEGRMNVELFKMLGIYDKVKPVKTDPIGKIFFPDYNIIIPGDAQEFKKMLLKFYPDEVESIDAFYDVTEKLDIVVNTGLYFMKGDYLGGIWETIKHPTAIWPFLKHMNSTTTEFLQDYIKNDKLIGLMSSLTGMLGDSTDSVSGLMFAGMWNGYHRGGYYYFEGGSQSITDALEKIIRENGGEILLSHLVTKIKVEDGRAVAVVAEDKKTKEVKEFKCRNVISNANAPDTFLKLIGSEHLPEDYVEDIKSRKIGPASFLVYLGVNKDYSKYYPGNTHELMVCYSSDAVENFKAWETGEIDKIPFGAANYSMVDPTAAPKGKNVIVITSLMAYDCYDNWYSNKSYEEYTKLKNDLAKVLVKRLEKYLPGLSSHVEVMEVATPRTNMRYTLNPKGSLFGWANTVENSMWNRLPQATPIDNLFLAGAWTLPCGGQSVVLLSGYMAAGMVLEELD